MDGVEIKKPLAAEDQRLLRMEEVKRLERSISVGISIIMREATAKARNAIERRNDNRVPLGRDSNQHRDEYDNALKAGGLTDSVKCPHCSTEYSFIVPGTHWEQLSLIRSKVKEIAGYEHPGHS